MVDSKTFKTDQGEPIYKVITLSIYGNSPLKREVSHEMFGWYHHLGAAALAVEQNALDMQDHAFNYALVSRSYQGGYGLNDEEIPDDAKENVTIEINGKLYNIWNWRYYYICKEGYYVIHYTGMYWIIDNYIPL